VSQRITILENEIVLIEGDERTEVFFRSASYLRMPLRQNNGFSLRKNKKSGMCERARQQQRKSQQALAAAQQQAKQAAA